jgi:hypothetical protein
MCQTGSHLPEDGRDSRPKHVAVNTNIKSCNKLVIQTSVYIINEVNAKCVMQFFQYMLLGTKLMSSDLGWQMPKCNLVFVLKGLIHVKCVLHVFVEVYCDSFSDCCWYYRHSRH